MQSHRKWVYASLSFALSSLPEIITEYVYIWVYYAFDSTECWCCAAMSKARKKPDFHVYACVDLRMLRMSAWKSHRLLDHHHHHQQQQRTKLDLTYLRTYYVAVDKLVNAWLCGAASSVTDSVGTRLSLLLYRVRVHTLLRIVFGWWEQRREREYSDRDSSLRSKVVNLHVERAEKSEERVWGGICYSWRGGEFFNTIHPLHPLCFFISGQEGNIP